MRALISLLDLLFYVYTIILLLRLLLQKLGANYFNPIVQFLVKVTEPIIRPLRSILPGFRGYDLAIVALVIVLEIISIWLVYGLRLGVFPGVFSTVFLLIGDLGGKLVNIFFFAIIIMAILSWFSSVRLAAVAELAQMLSYPIIRPLRRFIPTIGMFDLSTLAALILLKLVDIFVFLNFVKMGLGLAFS